MGAASPCQRRNRDGAQAETSACAEENGSASSSAQQTAMDSININYEVMRLDEKRREAAAKDEYVVVCDRTDGTSLGTKCEASDTSLLVHALVEGGLICKWNEANPDAAVRPHDRIVEVNGHRGRVATLISELQQEKLQVICLTRCVSSSSVEAPIAPAALQETGTCSSSEPFCPAVVTEPEQSAACDSSQAVAVAPNGQPAAAEVLETQELPTNTEVRVRMKTDKDCNQDDKIELEITLDRTDGTTLGIAARPSAIDGDLLVDSITGGLVAAWNEANPEYAVENGDRIVEINGVSGNADGLIAQCKELKVLRVKLVRSAPAPPS